MYQRQRLYRNTNQIIEYCKTHLPESMKMKLLGVDLGPVNVFDGLENAVNSIKRSDNKVFIVKDDYVLNSLNAYFVDLGMLGTKDETFAVTSFAALGRCCYGVAVEPD